MISHYLYCGIMLRGNGSKGIWGAVSWVDGSHYTCTYLFWGSPKKPMIKSYHPPWRRSKSLRLAERVKEKRYSWSGYTELTEADIKTQLPELESQIGMHILAKKLKFG